MTKLESITVSLEKAKELKEAGWPQNSENFQWVIDDDHLSDEWIIVPCDRDYLPHDSSDIDAPTAEQILRKLPEVLYLGENREAVYLSIMPDDYKWIVLYSPEYDQRRCDKEHFWKRSKTSLADAAAIMWLFLKNSNLLPPQ